MNTNETLRYINEMYNYHIEFENEFNGYLSKFYEKANELSYVTYSEAANDVINQDVQNNDAN